MLDFSFREEGDSEERAREEEKRPSTDMGRVLKKSAARHGAHTGRFTIVQWQPEAVSHKEANSNPKALPTALQIGE